jgi:hypothetical protein
MVVLYIFTHNKTGLKYFGKTIRFKTEKELLVYGGSGRYWKNHLSKHGKDLTVEIYGIYDINEVEEIALKFSEENDIVKSSRWANLILENGLDGNSNGRPGGFAVSEETKEKMRIANKNSNYVHSEDTKKRIGLATSLREVSEETRQKISNSKKGKTFVSEETKEKISKTLKEKSKTPEMQEILRRPKGKQKMVICPHCKKEGGVSNMNRYHFDNCKNI